MSRNDVPNSKVGTEPAFYVKISPATAVCRFIADQFHPGHFPNPGCLDPAVPPIQKKSPNHDRCTFYRFSKNHRTHSSKKKIPVSPLGVTQKTLPCLQSMYLSYWYWMPN